MRLIEAREVAAALPFDALIPALRALLVQGCEAPPRLVLDLAGAEAAGRPDRAVTSLVMPAWVPGRFYGVKVINIAAGNGARGLPGLHASYLLHDAVTGEPLALMDGNELTARRTAAASALAASWLARPDASRLLVLGAGRIARLLPHAYRAVRPIAQVQVWARRPLAAQALAEAWRSEGFVAEAVSDLAAAVPEADIVSTATASTEPLVRGQWLRPGSHLDLIGSFAPAMREADDACLAGAALYLDSEEALGKSGELLGPLARGVISADAVRGTLVQLARAEVAGRSDAAERTVFKSVGMALEDLAAAMQVWACVGGGDGAPT